jgi:hypothetical protein
MNLGVLMAFSFSRDLRSVEQWNEIKNYISFHSVM